jgi:hypothetical protein
MKMREFLIAATSPIMLVGSESGEDSISNVEISTVHGDRSTRRIRYQGEVFQSQLEFKEILQWLKRNWRTRFCERHKSTDARQIRLC